MAGFEEIGHKNTEMPQFEPLWMPNFMQEIRKIERAVFSKKSGRTHGRTHESEFIGSNPVNRGTNKNERASNMGSN